MISRGQRAACARCGAVDVPYRKRAGDEIMLDAHRDAEGAICGPLRAVKGA